MKTYWKNGQDAPSEKNQKWVEQFLKNRVCVRTIFLSTFKDSDDVTVQWA
jgi:hypothetical protein